MRLRELGRQGIPAKRKEKEPDATLPPIVASNHNVTTRFLSMNYNILIIICKGGKCTNFH